MGINHNMANEILYSDEFKNKARAELWEDYKNIFNNFN